MLQAPLVMRSLARINARRHAALAAMSRPVLTALLSAAVPWSGHAAQSSIHKCLIDGVTQYQDAPCDASQVSIPATAAAASSVRGPAAEAFPAETERTAGANRPIDALGPGRGGELSVGMSDTVVLNRVGWGRPHRITRSRSPEGFREEWTYAARSDGSMRVLHFLNGRLAAIAVEAKPSVAVQMPSDVPAAASTGSSQTSRRPTDSATSRLDVQLAAASQDRSATVRPNDAAEPPNDAVERPALRAGAQAGAVSSTDMDGP